jgi:hypothetical protein
MERRSPPDKDAARGEANDPAEMEDKVHVAVFRKDELKRKF